VGVMLALRRRAVRTFASRFGMPVRDALMLLNTPSWRVSAWRKPAAAAVLSGRPTPTPLPRLQSSTGDARHATDGALARPDDGTRLSTPGGTRPDDATRLS
jgi:hypothetical protein